MTFVAVVTTRKVAFGLLASATRLPAVKLVNAMLKVPPLVRMVKLFVAAGTKPLIKLTLKLPPSVAVPLTETKS